MDIATITSTIGSAVGLLKQIGEQVKNLQNRDLNQEVIELQQHILSVQTGLSELAEENRRLRDQMADLRRSAEVEKELIPDAQVYWWTRDGKKDGPYCKTCWHSSHCLSQLTSLANPGQYMCAKCNGYFNSAEYQNHGGGFFAASHRSFDEL
ncbi:MAG: hypothetical protein ACRD3T_06895 [Terriglobia bacterium]